MTLYLPLSHPTLKDHWRVPVYKAEPPLYTIKADLEYIRVFTEQSLPDYIRTKMVIADATFNHANLGREIKGLEDLYMYRDGEPVKDIAWRYNKHNYVVVLNNVEFNTLLGTEWNGYGNTREES